MKIVEVAPRDGLQNETAPVPTESKVAFVDALSATGVSEIEVSAFVSPRRVPQLADAREVFGRIYRREGVVYSALVPNVRGLDRAIESRVDKVSVFTAASETFNRKNINASIKGSIQRFLPVLKRAQSEMLPVRGYVSTAFWCAFEGMIPPEAVIGVVEKLFDIGIDEVSISDTIGKASPDEVKRLLDLLVPRISSDRIAMHFHDTYGRGVENVLASWAHGIRIFDASVGGWLAKTLSYSVMYELALLIPAISVLGVTIGRFSVRLHRLRLRRSGMADADIRIALHLANPDLAPNWYILGGSAAFVMISLTLGLSDVAVKKEAIFFGSFAVIAYLMSRLLRDLEPVKRREIIGIAIIIFIFRAMPGVGAGASWWQIDALGFDEAFFGTLRQIAAILAIIGLFALRGWMSRRPITYLVVFLSVYNAVMMLPFIGMYHGLHHWTEAHLGFGARTIAIIDTMADSPLGQVVMVPMLAWIAREAPTEQKATYFAVMAAFTNLALSAANLGTKYLNRIFVVERGNYSELGSLMVTAAIIGLIVPPMAVLLVNLWKRLPPAGTTGRISSDSKTDLDSAANE
jgi:hydroxymethylglutaryl-CoA lyase